MNLKFFSSLLILTIFFTNCKKENDNEEPITLPASAESLYFPPISSNQWETESIVNLNWNENAVQPLTNFLSQTNTKSFIILVNGRIIIEKYFDGHTGTTDWEWNSAGKTLVSAMVGIAQQEAYLSINNQASDYLGTDWTNMPLSKENLITVKHLLSMTSGIDDTKQLVIKSNLTYVADADTRWAYGNVFQKLMDVTSEATNQDFDLYFNSKLKSKIGMNGYWNNGLIFKRYYSNTRSMARFGVLALNNGKWENEQVINESFFKESVNPSQSLNNSYGYFWWLNGKSSFMIPEEQTVYPGPLVPNAPTDMYAAMGANEQRIYVIPSEKMVVVRMGEAADTTSQNFALSGFDNMLWSKINDLTD